MSGFRSRDESGSKPPPPPIGKVSFKAKVEASDPSKQKRKQRKGEDSQPLPSAFGDGGSSDEYDSNIEEEKIRYIPKKSNDSADDHPCSANIECMGCFPGKDSKPIYIWTEDVFNRVRSETGCIVKKKEVRDLPMTEITGLELWAPNRKSLEETKVLIEKFENGMDIGKVAKPKRRSFSNSRSNSFRSFSSRSRDSRSNRSSRESRSKKKSSKAYYSNESQSSESISSMDEMDWPPPHKNELMPPPQEDEEDVHGNLWRVVPNCIWGLKNEMLADVCNYCKAFVLQPHGLGAMSPGPVFVIGQRVNVQVIVQILLAVQDKQPRSHEGQWLKDQIMTELDRVSPSSLKKHSAKSPPESNMRKVFLIKDFIGTLFTMQLRWVLNIMPKITGVQEAVIGQNTVYYKKIALKRLIIEGTIEQIEETSKILTIILDCYIDVNVFELKNDKFRRPVSRGRYQSTGPSKRGRNDGRFKGNTYSGGHDTGHYNSPRDSGRAQVRDDSREKRYSRGRSRGDY